MTKAEAVALFGSQAAIARALGVTRGYISQWPDVLEERIADRVRGAALRLGLLAPATTRKANGRIAVTAGQ